MGCGYSSGEFNFQQSAHSRRSMSDDHKFIEERHVVPVERPSADAPGGECRTPSQNTTSTAASTGSARKKRLAFFSKYHSWSQSVVEERKTVDEDVRNAADKQRPSSSYSEDIIPHPIRRRPSLSRDDLLSDTSSFVVVRRKVVVAWEGGEEPSPNSDEGGNPNPEDINSQCSYNFARTFHREDTGAEGAEEADVRNLTDNAPTSSVAVASSEGDEDEDRTNENRTEESEQKNHRPDAQQSQFRVDDSQPPSCNVVLLQLRVTTTTTFSNDEDHSSKFHADENISVDERASVAKLSNDDFDGYAENCKRRKSNGIVLNADSTLLSV